MHQTSGRSGTVTNHTQTHTQRVGQPRKKLSGRGVAKADATNRHLCIRIPDPCRVKKHCGVSSTPYVRVYIIFKLLPARGGAADRDLRCLSVSRHSLLPACAPRHDSGQRHGGPPLSLAVDRWGKSWPAAHSGLVALPPTSRQSYHGPMYIYIGPWVLLTSALLPHHLSPPSLTTTRQSYHV